MKSAIEDTPPGPPWMSPITEELYARLSALSPTPLLAHDRSELQEG